MIKKTIKIGETDVDMKASATVPRIYRAKFGRDIFKDLASIYKDIEAMEEDDISFPSLELFENVAYIMAYHAAPEEVTQNIDEWMEQFGMMDIYNALPEVLQLWGLNVEVQEESGKKLTEVIKKGS